MGAVTQDRRLRRDKNSIMASEAKVQKVRPSSWIFRKTAELEIKIQIVRCSNGLREVSGWSLCCLSPHKGNERMGIKSTVFRKNEMTVCLWVIWDKQPYKGTYAACRPAVNSKGQTVNSKRCIPTLQAGLVYQ
jgi:hypothetical protein